MAWTEEYRKEVVSFLHTVKKHGGTVLGVNDGEDWVSPHEAAPVETILSVEVSWMYARRPGTDTATAFYIVLGNAPGELVADYSYNEWSQAVVDEHVGRWEK